MNRFNLIRTKIRHQMALRDSELSMTFHYSGNDRNELANLCDKYGSDKGSHLSKEERIYPWEPHTYTDLYALLFSHCRSKIAAVFECGIGTNNPNIDSNMGAWGRPGASLRVWRDYFPNAAIIGADIDRQILFEEERISTYWVDQRDPETIRILWKSIPEMLFDLMIDDGLHEYEAGLTLFRESIHRLSRTGIYIIEDVSIEQQIEYRRFFTQSPYEVSYINMRARDREIPSNSLILIRHKETQSNVE